MIEIETEILHSNIKKTYYLQHVNGEKPNVNKPNVTLTPPQIQSDRNTASNITVAETQSKAKPTSSRPIQSIYKQKPISGTSTATYTNTKLSSTLKKTWLYIWTAATDTDVDSITAQIKEKPPNVNTICQELIAKDNYAWFKVKIDYDSRSTRIQPNIQSERLFVNYNLIQEAQ